MSDTNGTWPAPAKPGSSVWEAWNDQVFEDRYKGNPDSFRMGWEAAMRSIWDRLPAPEYARDPMTPREVAKLLDYVRANLPNTHCSTAVRIP